MASTSNFDSGLDSILINKPPFFNGANYAYWKNRMIYFIQASDMGAWNNTTIIEAKNLKSLTLEELISSLFTHEMMLEDEVDLDKIDETPKEKEKKKNIGVALKSTKDESDSDENLLRSVIFRPVSQLGCYGYRSLGPLRTWHVRGAFGHEGTPWLSGLEAATASTCLARVSQTLKFRAWFGLKEMGYWFGLGVHLNEIGSCNEI
ncbi:hypothetical protein F3Y22_tig00111207pilonHSYRG00230 [Hibiscus syriacus]|uniref:DUF4219 domain-containing protein n=1 Tax=Hibiscus syriacus TaxID=106335 RepID=A0A6A2YVY4_HIBSY|nr:hypothetical protein F3Y22_tig00111207pilonHSYRG00230 [Hibiscus syriacus]